jgi:hypothetical protein
VGHPHEIGEDRILAAVDGIDGQRGGSGAITEDRDTVSDDSAAGSATAAAGLPGQNTGAIGGQDLTVEAAIETEVNGGREMQLHRRREDRQRDVAAESELPSITHDAAS